MSDDTKRPARRSAPKLRVRTTGSYRSLDPAWGINFGPDSDVDQVIPGSSGRTLRQLRDAHEIPSDCFEAVDADEAPREG